MDNLKGINKNDAIARTTDVCGLADSAAVSVVARWVSPRSTVGDLGYREPL